MKSMDARNISSLLRQRPGLTVNAALFATSLTLAACNSNSGTPPPSSASVAAPTGHAPNVLIILADDLGYSDLGAFGSEISTPNLDQLAAEGKILTNFHTTPLCATSRADLITGADHHLVGMGTLPESTVFYPDDIGYDGDLNQNARTIAQLLHDNGYHTYMAGKWHLGKSGPWSWGFEQSFTLQPEKAFGSNFAPAADNGQDPGFVPYFENGVQAQIPDDFYSSDYFTSKIEQYIGQNHGDGKPFFAYLAFQATHFPIQAPDAYLNRYAGVYDGGYQAIRDARIAKQKQLGLIPQDFVPNPGDEALMIRFGQPGVMFNWSWNILTKSEQQSEARQQEVFAAMLTDLDDNVGNLFAYLKQIGEYDNTLILFTSDNGADGMGYGFLPYVDSDDNKDMNNALDNYGRPGSFIFRSTRWAEASTAPFRLFKGFTAEGGLSVPAIVRLPNQAQGQPPSAALTSLLDVAPTILAEAGIPDPGSEYQGHPVAPLEGVSMLPVLLGQATQVHNDEEVFADEVNDIRYVRQGPWKMTRVVNYLLPSSAAFIDHDWQLYNLDSDRGETSDVSTQNPAVVSNLTTQWQNYVQRVDVAQPTFPPLSTPIDQ